MASAKVKKECFTFEPQQWRKSVCKNCFRTEPEHLAKTPTGEASQRLPQMPVLASTPVAQSPTAAAQPQSSAHKARAAARKQREGESGPVRGGPWPPEGQAGNLAQSGAMGVFSSASSIDARYVEELENDFFELEDKYDNITRDKEELSNELSSKLCQIDELQAALEQYREKITSLERRCTHFEEEVKVYRERLRLPESDQGQASSTAKSAGDSDVANVSADLASATKEDLIKRVNYMEEMCQEVSEENEILKEEIEEMQREIEEMHDHFQEEGRDTMREMQRDLEAANKTCRILQFKLRKAERRFDQCESERANLEERLARLEAELYSEADVAHIRSLEEELRVAKEVGVRLNGELDLLDEKRAYYEEENRQLKEELQVAQNRRISTENELGRFKLEMEKIKNETGLGEKGPLQVTDKNRSRMKPGASLSREASFEEKQLQKELEMTKEREIDLSEQLRFAEEEVRKLKRRLQDSHADNEALSRKIGRMVTSGQVAPITSTDLAHSPRSVISIPSLNAFVAEINKVLVAGEPAQMKEQLGVLRDKMVQSEADKERLAGENKRLRLLCQLSSANGEDDDVADKATKLMRSGPTHSTIQATREAVDEAIKENEVQKQRLKEWDRRLKQIVRDFTFQSSMEKGEPWLERYNDARESLRDVEQEKDRLRKRMTELQEENTQLRANQRKGESREKRARQKGVTAGMSREALVQEFTHLEEEIDELTAELSASKELASSRHSDLTLTEAALQDARGEVSRREKEFCTHIAHLESKNVLIASLLEIVQERADELQTEFDKLVGPSSMSQERGSSDAKPSVESSAGSNDVFDEQSTATGVVDIDQEKLRSRARNLERLLNEERQRSRTAEKQLELALQDSPKSIVSPDVQLKGKEIAMLKKELEEKDELVEERESAIRDLTNKLDHARKMNDALKTLVDKDSFDEDSASESRASRIESKQQSMEVAATKRELDYLRKQHAILMQNISTLEKQRDKMQRDHKELQEELKLREESIFEQDDELQKRMAEIKSLKQNLETIQLDLDQTKENLTEAKKRETAGTSGRLGAQIAENERIRAELNNTIHDLKKLKSQNEHTEKLAHEQAEKVTALQAELAQKEAAMREKDGCVVDLNKQLKVAKEQSSNAQRELKNLKADQTITMDKIKELTDKLADKQQQVTVLQNKVDEYMKVTSSRLEQDQGATGTDAAHGSSAAGNARRSEIERLKRELQMMRRDRDEIIKDAKREKAHLEKKLNNALERQREVERGSMTSLNTLSLPTGDAYVRAIAAQQSHIKISLMNEHIMRQTRYAMELKVQNESLNNSMLEYQRKYRSIKEQYDAEQEAWLTERVMLESLAREQEDRRIVIANTRRSLQQVSVRLAESEAQWARESSNLHERIAKLEKENGTMKSRLVAFEEQQKLPKVLQRFSGPSARVSSNLAQAATSGQNGTALAELQRRLDISERNAQKARQELADKTEARNKEHVATLQKYELVRLDMEREIESMREQLIDMETFRQQAELFCQRQREVESIADREFKLWTEEREVLTAKAEDAKVSVDQWCTRLQHRNASENNKQDEVVEEIVAEMEKWRSGKNRSYLKRRTTNLSRGDADSLSVPPSPASAGLQRGMPQGQLGPHHRSTSMEWFSRMVGGQGGLAAQSQGGAYKGSAFNLTQTSSHGGVGGLGSNFSLLQIGRCGRSVSPDVSIRKMTNYPDPSPGFALRSHSRQASNESLCSMNGDYSQRAFTLPGKGIQRTGMSAAKRRFFEDNGSASGSTLDLSGPVTSPLMTSSVTSPFDNDAQSTDYSATVSTMPARTSSATIQLIKPNKKTSTKTVEIAKSPPEHVAAKPATTSKLAAKSSSLVDKISSKFHTKPQPSSVAVASDQTKATMKPPIKVEPAATNLPPKTKDTKETKEAKTAKEPVRSPSIAQTKKTDTSGGSPAAETRSGPESRRSSRSGSVTTISPSIMQLRQKFSGGKN